MNTYVLDNGRKIISSVPVSALPLMQCSLRTDNCDHQVTELLDTAHRWYLLRSSLPRIPVADTDLRL